MFETLDVMLSLAVVFLILSMVNKYLMSIIKRALRIKAGVAAEEMKTFIGENTVKLLIPYLDRNARHLNFLTKTKKGPGVRRLTHRQIEGLVDNLTEYLEDKDNIRDIQHDLGLGEEFSHPGPDIDKIKIHLRTLKKRIRDMYDNTLENISEVYTNRLRTVTLCCGIVLALAINADFFDIFNSISKSAVVRKQLALQADLIRNDTSGIYMRLNKNMGEDIKEIKKDVNLAKENIRALTEKVEEAGVRLGWTRKKFNRLFGLSGKTAGTAGLNTGASSSEGAGTQAQKGFTVVLNVLSKTLGLLISGLLISFGAPFWHDFLSSISGVRRKLRAGVEKQGGSSTREQTG